MEEKIQATNNYKYLNEPSYIIEWQPSPKPLSLALNFFKLRAWFAQWIYLKYNRCYQFPENPATYVIIEIGVMYLSMTAYYKIKQI